MDLQRYDGKRICVFIEVAEKGVPACGVARYEHDDLLGGVLRIKMTATGEGEDIEVLISEAEWNGKITTDPNLNCDFCFIPHSDTSN